MSVTWGITVCSDPGGYPSALSPEPPTPDFTHAALVCSVLPPLEPKVSGCEQIILYWPFEKRAVSIAVCPGQTETILLFKAECYVGTFPASDALGGEAWLGV